MSKDDQKDKPLKEGQNFDMYHFFSRKDVILVVIVIVALLLYLLSAYFTGNPA